VADGLSSVSQDSDTWRMNPWLRMLAAFGVAIAAALFLKVLPPLIVLVFFIGGIAAVNLRLRGKVKDERKGFASEALGLKVEREDPFGLTGYPFTLFSRCEASSIEDVRWGTWRGLEVKRFDLACATRAGEQVRFGCAIGPIAPAAVPLVIEAAVWGTLLGDPPFDAVAVGAADGERGYAVRCADPGFARTLVGPEMIRWVGDLDEPWGFEIHGSLLLVYGPPSVGVEEPLERLHAFVNLAGAALTPAGTEAVPPRPDASSEGGEG
jgi:hypothetical protein